MPHKLHVYHLTGTKLAIKNNFFSDELDELSSYPRRSISQMFFTPYKSKEDFIFCARQTAQPVILLGLGLLSPIGLALGLSSLLVASLGCALIAAGSKCYGNKFSAWNWLSSAEYISSLVLQAIINFVLLPITALTLITRGISTGLKAAKLYDHDAPVNPVAGIGVPA